MVPSSSRPSDHTAVLEASNDMVRCPMFDAKNVGHFLVWPRVFVSIDETPFVFFADASPCYIARVLIRVVQLILYFSNWFEIGEKRSCLTPPSYSWTEIFHNWIASHELLIWESRIIDLRFAIDLRLRLLIWDFVLLIWKWCRTNHAAGIIFRTHSLVRSLFHSSPSKTHIELWCIVLFSLV